MSRRSAWLAALIWAGASLSASAATSSGWPANPFGTVFAPWNSLPGGFSPLNSAFSSGPFSPFNMANMSPFGGSGSPWGGVPNNVMPWNAWSSGSMMPWANQLPFQNGSGFPNMGGWPSPWGSNWNNAGSWMNPNSMPWWGSSNRYRDNRSRDALQTLLLLEAMRANNSGGLVNGLGGLPGLPLPYGGNASNNHPLTAPLPPSYVPPRSLTPSSRPGAPMYPYPQPPQSQPAAPAPAASARQPGGNPFLQQSAPASASTATGRAFNPFATPPQQTETAPIPPQPPARLTLPPRGFDPFAGEAAQGQTDAQTMVPALPGRSGNKAFVNPFAANPAPGQPATKAQGLRFPDENDL
ncbi:MAG: hypothetical protein R3E95_01615 [Thiolinea sp.]